MIVRLKGIKRATAKGRVYYYHRATGERIRAEPGSAAFAAEVAELDARAKAPKSVQTPGTWPWLVELYRAAPEFTDLAPRTKLDYQRLFDYLVDPEGDGSKPGLKTVTLDKLTTPQLITLRDKAAAKHGRRWGNYVIERISALWNWGLPRGHTKGANPATGVPKLARPKTAAQPNRPWADNELDAVLAAAPAPIRLAVALAAFVGLRGGDALTLPWSAYDGSAIRFRQHKTGDEVWVPAHRRLRTMLDAAQDERKALPERPARPGKRPKPIPLTVVANQRGVPFTKSGFTCNFIRLIRELETAGKVGQGLTFHGLRHTVATRLAEAGADDRIIMAILGHRSPRMAQHYSRRADRKRAAAAGIKLLERKRD